MRGKACFWYLLFLIFLGSQQVFAAKGSDWLDIPPEYREQVIRKLNEGKQYTAEQLKVISGCLEKTSSEKIADCLSGGGLGEVTEIYSSVKSELKSIAEEVCGKSSFWEKNRCEKLEEQLSEFSKQLKTTWSDALQKGKQYLQKKNELLLLKRNICDKIDQEGCWSWLNERIDLRCNPSKLKDDPEKLHRCRMKTAEGVWERLNDQQ